MVNGCALSSGTMTASTTTTVDIVCPAIITRRLPLMDSAFMPVTSLGPWFNCGMELRGLTVAWLGPTTTLRRIKNARPTDLSLMQEVRTMRNALSVRTTDNVPDSLTGDTACSIAKCVRRTTVPANPSCLKFSSASVDYCIMCAFGLKLDLSDG